MTPKSANVPLDILRIDAGYVRQIIDQTTNRFVVSRPADTVQLSLPSWYVAVIL